MKACSYVIFTGMSKAEFGQSVHDMNSLLVTEDKQCSLRWKNEIRGSPKVLVGLVKSKDES